MKVEQNTSFQPVTITIESQEELDLLTALYGNCPSYITDMFGIDSYTVSTFYTELTMLPTNKSDIIQLDISMEQV